MPRYVALGTDAATLLGLLDEAEAAGQEVTAFGEAGDSWVVVTKAKPKPGRPPKNPQTRA